VFNSLLMRIAIIALLWIAPLAANAQLTGNQQKALNDAVSAANQSSDEVTATVKSIISYYQALSARQTSRSPRYVCPVQRESYYYTKALEGLSSVGPGAGGVMKALKELNGAAEKIDIKCKALDTYHKVEDYKADNFAGGERLVLELLPLLENYKNSQNLLLKDIDQFVATINKTATGYRKADLQMQKQLLRERAFLDLWKLNMKEQIHTGWIAAQFEKSIAETEEAVLRMAETKPEVKYPASGMWPSFVDGLRSILDQKKSAIDQYNHQAMKSDKHTNDVYLSLINYYNGVLVAFYNSFIDYSASDGYRGVKAMKYFPAPTIRDIEERKELVITPYKELDISSPVITPQKIGIPKTVFLALGNYVDLINESWRHVSHFRDVAQNLSSSASYYATLTTFTGRGGMHFRHEGFNVPQSYLLKALADSKALNQLQAQSLNAQSEVIIDVLREMNEVGIMLEQLVSTKQYEQDHCKRIYELLERSRVLYEVWDEKKEKLFTDTRAIFDSYVIVDQRGSWNASGKALWDLTRLDHTGLYQAKRFYKGDQSVRPSVGAIEETVRDVLLKEYDNMKGIQKLGRNHGRCPYTPYEDLPKYSRFLSEALTELSPVKEGQYARQHPYHRMVYHYNDIVDAHNKFAELSPVPLLKTVRQPELFVITYPKTSPSTSPSPSQQVSSAETTFAQDQAPSHARQKPAQPVVTEVRQAQHTTFRDTIYIEKRDTIYLRENETNLRSMEGYATNNLVLLLDVSGSMNNPERLPLLKRSVLDLLTMMRAEDEIAIVVFSGKPKVLLPPVSCKEQKRIEKAIMALKPAGTTDGNTAIRLAYKVADENYMRGGNNRIILATDGEFPLADDTRKLIERFSKEDIFISVFTFGKAGTSANGLQEIASLGKGSYHNITRDNVEVQLIREVKAKRK
jgi:Ca-activated chloride channel homolog